MPGFFDAATGGFNNGVGIGASMYKDELERQRQAKMDAMNAPVYDAPAGINLPMGAKMTRAEAVAQASKLADIEANKKLAIIGKNSLPPGVKLAPDQVYDPSTGMAKAIPGSKLYQTEAGLHNKDLAKLQGVQQKSQMANAKIDDILSKPENIASQFGGYNALVSQYFNPDAKIKIESLKSNLKSAGLELIKNGGGIGAISEAEWPIMEGLIGKLDPRMSEEEATNTLKEIQARFKNMQERTDQAYQLQWGNTPYTHPMQTGPSGAAPTQAPAATGKRYQIISAE